jgi:hypothetical protein
MVGVGAEHPSGAKAHHLCAFHGTAEAVPFQSDICAASFSVVFLNFTTEIEHPNRRSFDSVCRNKPRQTSLRMTQFIIGVSTAGSR